MRRHSPPLLFCLLAVLGSGCDTLNGMTDKPPSGDEAILRKQLVDARSVADRARASARKAETRASDLGKDKADLETTVAELRAQNERLTQENLDLKRRLQALGRIESTLSDQGK